MIRTQVRVLLVIGNNHKAISDKYRCDKTEEVEVMRVEEAPVAKERHIKYLEEAIKSPLLARNPYLRDTHKDLLELIKGMTDEQYFEFANDGARIENGVAYSKKDPRGYYHWPRSGQEILDKTGRLHDFLTPFKLLDGNLAYTARKGDIDWSEMHLTNPDLYRRTWELCVERQEPKSERDRKILENMGERRGYFSNFKSADEYINHNTSFWTYFVADDKKCESIDDGNVSDKQWVAGFYEKYIEQLSDDTILSLYEVRIIDENP